MVSRLLALSLWPLFIAFFMTLVMSAPIAVANPTPTDTRGRLQRWPITIASPQISYRVAVPEGVAISQHLAFTERAAQMWTDVGESYIELVELSEDDPAKEQITIVLTRQFSGNSRSGGFAIFDEWDSAGPRHCRIEVPIKPLMRSGFPRTILHELGHCIGLGHSLVPESVMSYDLSKSGFYLAIDDQAGAAQLYPADGSAPRPPLSCGTIHPRLHARLSQQGSSALGSGAWSRSAWSSGAGILAACHLVVLLFGLAPIKNPRPGSRRSGDQPPTGG